MQSFFTQAGLIMQIMVIYQASCGGSLISVNRVLTAAHCYHDGQITAENFTVVLGSNFLFYGGTRIFTTDVAIHPNWNTDTLQNDIAVLRINPVAFSSKFVEIFLWLNSNLNENIVASKQEEVLKIVSFQITSSR